MRVVQSEIVVEYDSIEEMKDGNRSRNADKWKVFGKHTAEGKFFVYYRKRVPFAERKDSFPVVFTKKGFSNFIQGKVYEARSRFVHSNGTPSYYEITDEDGDSYHIGDSPLKLERGWELFIEED